MILSETLKATKWEHTTEENLTCNHDIASGKKKVMAVEEKVHSIKSAH